MSQGRYPGRYGMYLFVTEQVAKGFGKDPLETAERSAVF